MQTKPTPSEGQNSAKLEAESALRDAACSPLDLYATAALTGLLANPTVIASMGARAYIGGNADEIPVKLVAAAFHYAEYAMKVRFGILSENADVLAPSPAGAHSEDHFPMQHEANNKN